MIEAAALVKQPALPKREDLRSGDDSNSVDDQNERGKGTNMTARLMMTKTGKTNKQQHIGIACERTSAELQFDGCNNNNNNNHHHSNRHIQYHCNHHKVLDSSGNYNQYYYGSHTDDYNSLSQRLCATSSTTHKHNHTRAPLRRYNTNDASSSSPSTAMHDRAGSGHIDLYYVDPFDPDVFLHGPSSPLPQTSVSDDDGECRSASAEEKKNRPEGRQTEEGEGKMEEEEQEEAGILLMELAAVSTTPSPITAMRTSFDADVSVAMVSSDMDVVMPRQDQEEWQLHAHPRLPTALPPKSEKQPHTAKITTGTFSASPASLTINPIHHTNFMQQTDKIHQSHSSDSNDNNHNNRDRHGSNERSSLPHVEGESQGDFDDNKNQNQAGKNDNDACDDGEEVDLFPLLKEDTDDF